MIVTCERCGTQFQLDDSRVPKRGVRVRCSRCKNAFRVVPEGQRAAEEAAELARRAREEHNEESTQDLEDSRGSSGSRAGARRSADERGTAAAQAAEVSASGPLEEESDWKFNEDIDPRERSISGREQKPDPPESGAAQGARNADDWFGGGGNDAPLELDDRRGGTAAVEETGASASEDLLPDAPPPAPRPAREAPVVRETPAPREAPVVREAPALRETPVVREAPPLREAPADLFAPPPLAAPIAMAEEPSLPFPDPVPSPAPAPAPQMAAEPSAADELSSDSWDLLAAADAAGSEVTSEAGQQSAESERSSEPRRGLPSLAGAATRVARWAGVGAQTAGWFATCALFAAGLYAGLVPASSVTPLPERVAGLELGGLEGRFVENATSGSLYVVSGRVRNPGPEAALLEPLELELMDAAGHPLAGRAALRIPAPTVLLRESPASALQAQPPLDGAIQPGEERAFQVVLPALPAEATAFRVVASAGAAR